MAATALLTAALAASAAAAPRANPGLAGPVQRCQHITWDQVAGLFTRWSEALAGGDAEHLRALYAPDAMLLPAFAPSPRSGRDAIAAYYTDMLGRGARIRVVKRSIKIRCNMAIDAGVYALRLGAADGSQDSASSPARFTLVYEFQAGHWLIALDHASLVPSDGASLTASSPPAGLALPASDPVPAPAVAAPMTVIPVESGAPSSVPAERPAQ